MEEIIAKNNKNREIAESDGTTSADVLDGEMSEMPEEMGEMDDMSSMGNMGDMGNMGGGPMGGGGFPGEMTVVQNDTNEWLAPMVGAGITSGVVIIAAVVIGWMIIRLEKKLKKVA